MTTSNPSPLETLRLADPDTYVWVKGRVAMLDEWPDDHLLTLLAEETIWGLAIEPGLGAATAKGLLHLLSGGADAAMPIYVVRVRRAAETGATYGRIAATYWAPVLLAGEEMVTAFETTLATMLAKGTYTLNAPLEALAELLAADASGAAKAYLDLLCETFRQNISYNQSQRLVYLLPKAVRSFAPRRRKVQIEQLARVVGIDLRLVDPFVDGLAKGTGLLDPQALMTFVTHALERYQEDAEAGAKFLSLTSKIGQDACTALQKAVPLSVVTGQLSRYLHARVGRPVAIQSLADLPLKDGAKPWAASDGRCIYLPMEIDCYDGPDHNQALYKALIRLEAGYFECGTFDFDLERAGDCSPVVAQWLDAVKGLDTDDGACDGERFIRRFDRPRLASDLFTLYEQARIHLLMGQRYPGMMRQVLPLLNARVGHLERQWQDHLLAPVYARLVLHLDLPLSGQVDRADLQQRLIDFFPGRDDVPYGVEATAEWVIRAYAAIVDGVRIGYRYQPLVTPFERHLRWALVSIAFSTQEQSAARIQMGLAEKDLSVYRSDLRNRLADQQGQLSADDIGQLVLARAAASGDADAQIDLSGVDLTDLLGRAAFDLPGQGRDGNHTFRYPEWDSHLQDYLYDHTRVQEIELPATREGSFYQHTLETHYGMVARMRRAFEMLKPEGLALLRQWPEGDAFDYRALIDFAIDRRAGRIPSDRLFIKRLKQERDVAVLLLVDLSRSTANPVAGRHATVLGVAKKALVVFCEALQVVGDSYAIAGFSGTGRLSVDYFRIKDFQEPLSDVVRSRISALSPQRSTRMGAAIRHGTAQLARITSRVRLMVIVSDGFPNDLGYKADYAIADSRRAIQEARARGFHLKAITVNIGSDPRLDELYGRFHHHVIGDVEELPDKLLRLYSTLTRF